MKIRNVLMGNEYFDIEVIDGTIMSVEKACGCPAGKDEFDAGGLLLVPGFIDPHVHMREPGFEYKETLNSGAISALAGGVTSILDMPNTMPPTVNGAGAVMKIEKARNIAVNFGFYAGFKEKTGLLECLKIPSCAGVKLFLSETTGTEGSFNSQTIEFAFENSPLVLFHAEDGEVLEKLKFKKDPYSGSFLQHHNSTRPVKAVLSGLEKIMESQRKLLKKGLNCRAYICHVTSAMELELVKEARKEGLDIIVEASPHHLTFSLDNEGEVQSIFPGRKSSFFVSYPELGRVNPPLREERDRKALFGALLDGTIDVLGSDHAPHLLEEKVTSYEKALSGVPGVSFILPFLVDLFARGEIPYSRVLELSGGKISEVLGLKKKGKIEPGYDADFVLVNPFSKFELPAWAVSRCGWSLYEPSSFYCSIETVFLHGEPVVCNKEPVSLSSGKLLEFVRSG